MQLIWCIQKQLQVLILYINNRGTWRTTKRMQTSFELISLLCWVKECYSLTPVCVLQQLILHSDTNVQRGNKVLFTIWQ